MSHVTLREQIKNVPLQTIASRLYTARVDAKLSHDKLAEAAGTSRQHLISLEKGKHRPGPEMLERIATALGKEADWFLAGRSGNPDPFQQAA